MNPGDLRRRLDEALAHRPGHSSMRLQGPLQELTGGWASTSVHSCTLRGAGSGDGAAVKAVLKVYAADDDGIQHASREWRALTFLSRTACRVPDGLAFEPDPDLLGRPFLLMECIGGTSFWSAYEAADARGDDGVRADLVRSFVQPMVALHALDASELEPTAVRAVAYGAVDAELAGLHRDVEAFPRTGLVELVRWLQAGRDAVPCQRPVVLHRDYHPWNVIVDDAGMLWVLDWDWKIGDPRFDLAWTCTLVQRSGHDAFGDAVREEHARQSGAPVEEFGYFEVLATMRWLLNVLPSLGADSQLDPAKRADFRSFLVEPLRRARTLLGEHTGVDATVLG